MNFQPDKPFRLSLYVDSKERLTSPIKISRINDSFNINDDENNKENRGSVGAVKQKKDNKSKRIRGRLKNINVALFELENEDEPLKRKCTKSTVKKSQKSNENKENTTKPKEVDSSKENEEYEKWLQSISSEFDDIDKFELSVTYDN